MKENKLTKWEVGSILADVSDQLLKKAGELKDYPEVQKVLLDLQKQLSENFYKNNFPEEMGFGV